MRDHGMRDHGGDLGAAIARFGGAPADWIDLSTGINRAPWPLPPLPVAVVRALPDRGEFAACAAVARTAYGAGAEVACLPLAGAQAAIRLVPALRPAGRVGVVGPTYNEHAAAFTAAGWQVSEVADLAGLDGFDAAVVVNPNNPDGRCWSREAVAALAARNGLVVVDESFADAEPAGSLCPVLGGLARTIVLRSFGKFYGLAGLRLGFALGSDAEIGVLRELAGPWAVSGPALFAGRLGLADVAWAEATRVRLAADARRLDRLAEAAGWRVVGGTGLFRLCDTGDAVAAQALLAGRRIWSRSFPYSAGWLRLGLPGTEAEWEALAAALTPTLRSR
jgi:cobalamin biosynthetic protein CobC